MGEREWRNGNGGTGMVEWEGGMGNGNGNPLKGGISKTGISNWPKGGICKVVNL